MRKPTFSIITSVFNGDKYFVSMLECVLRQTYSNYQLVLIDDGSSDTSGYICDSLLLDKPNIIVAHSKNRGASGARNVGMQMASGDYLIIWDSDDYIDQKTLEAISLIVEKDEPDIIRYNFSTESNANIIPHIINYPYNIPLDRKYIVRNIIPYYIGIRRDENRRSIEHWTISARRSLIDEHGIGYNESQKKEEDHYFVAQLLAYANTIEFIRDPLYRYIKHEGSLVSQYSPRFDNICTTLAQYEKLFSKYYDFNGQEKVIYDISAIQECILYIYKS